MTKVRIELQPLGKIIEVEKGASLQDVLFPYGVEFPCGGVGTCRGCRVKVLRGELAITREQECSLTWEEITQGWRLACQCAAEQDVVLELEQWRASILSDESAFTFTPSEGVGIAVDLGTTTVVAQMLDLQSGQVLGVQSTLNPQARHGSDIMSRVQYAVAHHGNKELQRLIHDALHQLLQKLLKESKVQKDCKKIILAGNTVMHHLFCGIDVTPLSEYPFCPADIESKTFYVDELGWELPGNPRVIFLPGIGGFVGSDILAGIVALRIDQQEGTNILVDLGTNGEVVVGNKNRLICASTAAGPAFEGARISCGMRAATGAIAHVALDNGSIKCQVLGNTKARGICGSGLVDAAAIGLELNQITASGKLQNGQNGFLLTPPITLQQCDIRELQLAKGAIAAGIRILQEKFGVQNEEIQNIYLAGAFGNYINIHSAHRIGLIKFPPEKVISAGNTALLGAKLALFHDDYSYTELRNKIEHISLSQDVRFQETYIEEMGF